MRHTLSFHFLVSDRFLLPGKNSNINAAIIRLIIYLKPISKIKTSIYFIAYIAYI